MKRNFSLDLSVLALSALTALIIPSSVVIGSSSCTASTPKSVTSSISADTLSAASGTEIPLRISIENSGTESLKDGSVIILVSREPKANDFSKDSQFVVTRSVVKTGVNLEANSTSKFAFAWNIPASLPGGVYRADAVFAQGGETFDDATVNEKNPFGNSAKILVSGEDKGAIFFIASLLGDDSPKIVLVNGTGQNANVPVTIKKYSGGLSGNLIGSEFRTVFAKAGASTVVPYSSDGLVKPFSITAEATNNGMPAFYMYSSDGTAPCSNQDQNLYSWAMLIGGLGVIMLVLAYLKEKRA